MSAKHETAYPRFKSDLTATELDEIYTPSGETLEFAREHSKTPAEQFALLILLVTVPRLGYFVKCADVPAMIHSHIAKHAHMLSVSKAQLRKLERSGARHRLRSVVRARLALKAFDAGGAEFVTQTATAAAQTRQELADIINVVIEELVRCRYELPGFTTLQRAARHARAQTNTIIYDTIARQLPTETKSHLDQLLIVKSDASESSWQRLKREPKKPTNKEMQGCLEQLIWLNRWVERLHDVCAIPAAKWRQFNWEARSYDAASLKRMKPKKRYALMVMLFHSQLRHAMDDVVTIVTRKMAVLHNNARQRLEQYHVQRATKVDHLIDQFRNVLCAYNAESSDSDRLAGISRALADSPENLVAECDQHMAYAGGNYLPFMLGSYQAQRSLLLNALTLMNVESSSNDRSIVQTCQLVLHHRHSRKPTLPLPENLSLHWLSEKWRKLVTGSTNTALPIVEVNRKYFELCVLSQVSIELKTGDLFINHSEEYSDYRVQLLDWSDYHEQIGEYSVLLDLPSDPELFVAKLHEQFASTAASIDHQFPDNESVDIDDDGLLIRRPETRTPSAALKKLDQTITERLPEQNILDVLTETERWLNLHQQFKPITSFASKLDEPRKRFIATLFCYGCNLGPVQTARSVKELSRKQVA